MENIREGYKQTEVGVIPEDWKVKIADDVFTSFTNNTFSRNQLNYDEGEVLNIHYGDVLIKFGSIIDASICELPYIDASVMQKNRSFNYYMRNGDLVIADTAEDNIVGKACEVINVHNKKIVTGLHTIWLRPKDKFASRYLGYYTNSSVFHNQLLPFIQGIKVNSISKQVIITTKIVIPNYEEQCAIAKALSDIDSLISSLNKKIEKKKAFKQGLMQQLLTGKKRLSGFNGEWVEKKLGDISKIKTGNRNGNEQDPTGLYPFFVRSAEIQHIKTYSFDGEAILIPGEGGVGSIFHYINGKFDYHQRVYKVSDFCQNVNGKFIYYYMRNFFGNYAMTLTVKATVDSLRLPTFEQFVVVMPPTKSEQTSIATILSDVDKDILATEASRDKYIQIKSAMMQQLLTGKIRLVEPLQEKECSDEAKAIPIDAHIVGGHIVKKLYSSKGWGRTKLQKSLHLIGYCCQLDFGNEYIRNTAGPDDEKLMNYIDSKFKQYHHVVKEKEIFSNGHTHYIYKPTPQITEVEQAFASYPVKLRHRINALLDKMFNMDLARAEIVSTLYAVWNNRIIKSQEISDSLILSDFYDWSKHKSDFSKDLVLKALDYMRNNDIIPIGWGKYIDKK